MYKVLGSTRGFVNKKKIMFVDESDVQKSSSMHYQISNNKPYAHM